MEKLIVLLISSKLNEKKENELKRIANLKKVDCVFLNYNLNEYKEKLNLNKLTKNELTNIALDDATRLGEDCCVLNLDYNEETLYSNFNKMLESKDYDIVNFKPKHNKFMNFLSFLKYYIYNFILSLFGINKILNISEDFQFLNKRILKIISKTEKSPNYMRLFNNFSGFNIKTYEFNKIYVKSSKYVLFKVLALISLVLAIISLDFVFLIIFKYRALNYTTKLSLIGLIMFVSFTILSGFSFTYNKYKNSI